MRGVGALARTRAGARLAGALAASRTGAAMRQLGDGLTAALRARLDGPADVREVCAALCEAMGERRGGRRVDLRFERFPDEIEVTGLWLEFRDHDLVIVEERADAAQQLVILGHELWHMHAGHCRHPADGSGRRGRVLSPTLPAALRQGGTPVAARDGSHAADEREAEEFGHRLAADLRAWVAADRAGR
nr:toxin-antitoxin system, toxin component [Streptomyces ruber]